MNSYELSRAWFDWCFENPEKINPNHSAMYFFIIEHCNRLGWKEKFGLPMEMTKEAIGIKNYRTFSNTLKDLVDWGFIILVQKSKNQYSSNIIAIVKNTKAHTKANAKALDKALSKQVQKQVHGIVCIDKLINNETKEPINHELLHAREKKEINYSEFISKIIETINTNFKKEYRRTHFTGYLERQFVDLLKNFTQEEIFTSLNNLKNDAWAKKEGYVMCTPNWLSQHDTITRYLFADPKTQKKELKLTEPPASFMED